MRMVLGMAGNWYPDELGRAEYRFKDETLGWTHHVVLGGAQTVEDQSWPLNEIPAPPAAALVPPATYSAPVPSSSSVRVRSYDYAGFWLRVGAYIVDSFVTAPFSIAAMIVADTWTHLAPNPYYTDGMYNNYGFRYEPAFVQEPTGGAVAVMLVLYALGLAAWFWNSCHLQGTTGQSLGKKAVGIRLVSDETGNPIGTARAFGRQVLHILDVLSFGIGYLRVAWSPKKQTFADSAIGSVVVREG